MKIELSQIAFVLIAGTLLFVFIIFLLIVFFVIYQKRKNKTAKDIEDQKNRFEKEILSTQTEIREETMRFISQELHDNIIQTLAVTNLTLNTVEQQSAEIIQSKKALLHTIDQVKLLSKALNTSNIMEGGLIEGLSFEIDRLKQLKRWNIDYFNDVTRIDISKEKQLLVFRIFQELINNIIKYGQAQNIMIELEADASHYILKLTDDGNQYDFKEKANETGFTSGAGLKGLLNKTNLLKAKLKVKQNIKKGMNYILTVPVHYD